MCVPLLRQDVQAGVPRRAVAAATWRPAAFVWQPSTRRLAARASAAVVADSDSQQEVRVLHRDSRCKPVRLRPELVGELAPLAELCGVATPSGRAKLAESVAALGPEREQGVLQHGAGVATHLRQLGVQPAQMGPLLLRCPQLFSRPAEERAAPLFAQLMGRLGLPAEKAAQCFRQQPSAASVVTFEPAIEALAELFAAGSRARATARSGSAAGSGSADAERNEAADAAAAAASSGSGGSSGGAEPGLSAAERREGERLLGQLLRSAPAGVQLVSIQPDRLRQRRAALQQRYDMTAAQVVVATRQYPLLLARDPDGHLAKVEAALREELGVDGAAVVAAMLKGAAARAVGCGVDTLRARARALLQVRYPAHALLGGVWLTGLLCWLQIPACQRHSRHSALAGAALARPPALPCAAESTALDCHAGARLLSTRPRHARRPSAESSCRSWRASRAGWPSCWR